MGVASGHIRELAVAMGCKKRPGASQASRASAEPTVHVPKSDVIDDLWMRAVQNQDPSAAGACARICESLRGAEAFADSDGLDAFIGVAMGQEATGTGGGLMVALAQALM